ncbi:hypothetical protein ElyMa_006664700 [Elysia marginata]|uniref:Uncharacterized protein n=1 Tax=Elysia marginata TaxID=1093978 RepID=A0AAV4IP10_9GAST|nr:hypothetical protein ElyMa_006664700 [Elysia marginata]
MEVSTEISKFIVNSLANTSSNITTNGEPLKDVTNFKYLEETQSMGGCCTTEVRNRAAVATEAFARLNRTLKSNTGFSTKYKLYKSLLLSTLL